MKKQQVITALIISAIFAGTVFAAPYTPDAYTIALYHFDEAAASGLPQDSSFYTNNATSGQLATGDTGLFGNAIAFTNTNISIPDDPSFDQAQTNGTIEFWIKPNTSAIDYWGSDNVLVVKSVGGNSLGDFSIGYRMNPTATYGGGSIYLTMGTGAGTYRQLRTPNFITASQWYHIVVSWDSVSTPVITVDDTSQSLSDAGSDSSYVGPIFTASSAFSVGAQIDFAKAPGGVMLFDEFRLTIPTPPDTNRPAITYVVEPGTAGVTPTPSYTNWATAATNIQDAINRVVDGGTVLVSNGTYYLSATLEITNGITVRSYNNGNTDKAGTIINGNYPNITNRCVNLNGTGVTIDGFTITNGYAFTGVAGDPGGGGVYLRTGTIVTNCLVAGNETDGTGGGIYLENGGLVTASTISGNTATNLNDSLGGGISFSKSGMVTNCIIKNNKANKGGGLWFNGLSAAGGILSDSTIANNEAMVYASGQGGAGMAMYFNATVERCTIVSNVNVKINGSPYAAGIMTSYNVIIRDCVIEYNDCNTGYGGGLQLGSQAIMSNCIVRYNQAGPGGGVYLGNGGFMQNCTIVSNSSAAYCQGGTARNCLFAYNDSGVWSHNGSGSLWENCTVVGNSGVGMRFSQSNTVENCIVYENNSGGDNWSYDTTGSNTVWINSCTLPALTGPNDTGNITSAPLFVNSAVGNYHLLRPSPTVNAGIDRAWMVDAVDLDGEPRLIATVDMGVYELPAPRGSIVTIK